MIKDYHKVISIIRHVDNREIHLPAISMIILRFQTKWFNQPDRDGDWKYLEFCASINDEYDQLLKKLNITMNNTKHEEIDFVTRGGMRMPNNQVEQFQMSHAISQVGYIKGEPIAIRIIPSGWKDSYHVIVEFGDSENFDTHFLTKNQIWTKFGIEIKDADLSAIIRNNPNDYDLGKTIRGKFSNC